MKNTAAYRAIQDFYGERRAERSGVRLMQHIDDGLVVLDAIGASDAAKRAFCLHPLFQPDEELLTVGRAFAGSAEVDGVAVMLAMEYRARANAWLSDKVYLCSNDPLVGLDSLPSAGLLPEVKHMLIADKVQNRKDFITYHRDTHPRSRELGTYFAVWLGELGIDDAKCQELFALIDASHTKERA